MKMPVVNAKRTVGLTAVFLSLPIILVSTNPNKLPLPLLILPIVAVFVGCFVTSTLILKATKKGMSTSKVRSISALSAVLPTLLVVLQSIQQLSPKDILIVIGLWALLVWYLQRIDFF